MLQKGINKIILIITITHVMCVPENIHISMEVFFSSGKLGHVHTPSANWLAPLDVAGAPLARQAIFPLVGEERLRDEPKERLGMSFGGQFIYLFIYLFI